MSQVASTRTFGYSARALFGKDYRRLSLESNDEEYLPPNRNSKEISDGAKKLLKYIGVLQEATGKQYDNVLGRLHWMLKTSGSSLDLSDEDSVDKAFNALRDMVLDKTRSKSSRWKIMELLELRANNWEEGDSISEYYEDPANFMVPHAFINNNVPKLPMQDQPQRIVAPGVRLPNQPRPSTPQYVTTSPPCSPYSPYSVQSNSSIVTDYSPETPRTRTPSGDSSSRMSDRSRVRMASGGSGGRSRTGSSSSSGFFTYSRSNSAASGLSRQSSRKSVIDEDVFQNDDDSDRSDDNSDAGSSSSSISAAQYRLLHVNAGKPIKYTRTFLLGCWSSPLCKVMPSNLQHTIINSDIAYIIKGPPFEDPVRVMCQSDESAIPCPIKRSISLPAEPTQTMQSSPVQQLNPAHVRSQSNSEKFKLGGVTYYDAPTRFDQGYVPILHKDAWQKLFKNAIQQIDK